MGTGQRELHKLSHKGMDEHGMEEHWETLLIIGVLRNICREKMWTFVYFEIQT